MKPYTQMAMMRSQKTHPKASLAHQNKHLTIHKSKFDQELVKRNERNEKLKKELKDKNKELKNLTNNY